MKFLTCLYFIFLPLFAFAKAHLFVLFDAGETYALRPVIEKLIQEGEEVDVLALGTAQKLMPEAHTFPGVGPTWDRYASIPEEIFTSYHPEVVILGTASEIQLQFAEAFQDRAIVVAYYDNFNPIEHSNYVDLIREIETLTDLFLVSSELAAKSSHAKNVHIVGNPDIEEMIEQMGKVDSISIKKELGLDLTKPIVTYIGGYDDDYEEAFSLFVEGIKRFPDYQVVICPHPKTNGSLEKKFLKEACFPGNSLTSAQVVALADVVVCHRSTLGIKSLIAGKKVIFVDTLPSQVSDQWGAFSATNSEEFFDAMQEVPSQLKCSFPKQSSVLILQLFKKLE